MAAITRVGSIKKHFRKLKDPRVSGRCHHLFFDIVFMAICAVIADCDEWPEIAQFAREREAWFRRYLKLPHGIPSHDTFERLFAALNPGAFERCCVAWLHDIASLLNVSHIAIDGKTARGSAGKLGALHLVNAWATDAKLCLGQVAVEGKSNEITAIPQLLQLLDLHGALVTIDAMGCQKAIAEQIVAAGGDYILIVKANQERLLEDIQVTLNQGFEGALPKGAMATYTTEEYRHGRHETRSCVIVERVSGIRDRELWKGITTVGMCRRERTMGDKTSSEVWYFIGSRRMGARRYAEALRDHWGIENNLHWQLDVSFHEDDSRIEDRHGAANFAFMRKLALSLLKQDPRKDSMRRKRKGAALNLDYLAKVISGAKT
jgi:predicted transposase YbfD/YdcC